LDAPDAAAADADVDVVVVFLYSYREYSGVVVLLSPI
jgi:hypothetical protein